MSIPPYEQGKGAGPTDVPWRGKISTSATCNRERAGEVALSEVRPTGERGYDSSEKQKCDAGLVSPRIITASKPLAVLKLTHEGRRSDSTCRVAVDSDTTPSSSNGRRMNRTCSGSTENTGFRV